VSNSLNCPACNYKCSTCSGKSFPCDSCKLNRDFLDGNCTCKQGFYDLGN
jgi:hypothetical protein